MNANKTYLAQTIADQTGLSRNRSTQAVATIIKEFMAALATGDDVKIAGFGRFHRQTLKARTGRHPKTGAAIEIQARRTVRFKCYQQLKEKLNEQPTSHKALPTETIKMERRLEPRLEDLPKGKAVVRISGIPVCEFEIKDMSGDGTSILVEADSVVLRNLRVGQTIELHMVYADRVHHAVMQRSRIAHITHPTENDTLDGYVTLGLQILDTLPIR
jgi:nucleoid DNA-binding protein